MCRAKRLTYREPALELWKSMVGDTPVKTEIMSPPYLSALSFFSCSALVRVGSAGLSVPGVLVLGLVGVLLVVAFLLGFLLRAPESVQTGSMGLVMVVALFAFAAYIVLHEAVHGAFMWYFSKRKPHFGISLQYAYAGSESYFRKTPYLIIALAPFAVWGVVFGVVALCLNSIWFWLFWLRF